MSVTIIEGNLEPAQPYRNRKGYARFERLKITTADGDLREMAKIATAEPITSEAIKGGPGKFYFVTADGPMGLYGVRRPDGTRIYAHFMGNNEPIILGVGLLGTLCAIARFGFGYEAPLLAAILGPPLVAGWYYLSTKRKNAKRVFEADE